MSYDKKETSLAEGNPVECYSFRYLENQVNLTSSQRALEYNGTVFTPAYIRRDETLHLGNSGGTMEACKITVGRDSEIAHLYKGTPPEDDSVKVYVYRIHRDDTTDSDKYILLVKGIVSQVTFNDAEAELTVSIENGLNRYIPRGILSYYCQNNIYDNKCRVSMSEHGYVCDLDIGIEGLRVYSRWLKLAESGYYNEGLLEIGGYKRAIVRHYNDYIELKYPLPDSCKEELKFTVYPSCLNTFYLCHTRFNNIDNFTGIPVIPPYNAFTHPTHGAEHLPYWVHATAVRRDTNGEIFDLN